MNFRLIYEREKYLYCQWFTVCSLHYALLSYRAYDRMLFLFQDWLVGFFFCGIVQWNIPYFDIKLCRHFCYAVYGIQHQYTADISVWFNMPVFGTSYPLNSELENSTLFFWPPVHDAISCRPQQRVLIFIKACSQHMNWTELQFASSSVNGHFKILRGFNNIIPSEFFCVVVILY